MDGIELLQSLDSDGRVGRNALLVSSGRFYELVEAFLTSADAGKKAEILVQLGTYYGQMLQQGANLLGGNPDQLPASIAQASKELEPILFRLKTSTLLSGDILDDSRLFGASVKLLIGGFRQLATEVSGVPALRQNVLDSLRNITASAGGVLLNCKSFSEGRSDASMKGLIGAVDLMTKALRTGTQRAASVSGYARGQLPNLLSNIGSFTSAMVSTYLAWKQDNLPGGQAQVTASCTRLTEKLLLLTKCVVLFPYDDILSYEVLEQQRANCIRTIGEFGGPDAAMWISFLMRMDALEEEQTSIQQDINQLLEWKQANSLKR